MDLFVTGLRKPGGDAYEPLKGTRTRTYFRVGDLTRANVEAGWQMVALLRRHGHRAYEVYSAIPPGIITFIDDRQIVVREASGRG